VFGVFAFLAILIACFGLLGLSAYNDLQRTKEIGIRKVLGASVQNILFFVVKRFSQVGDCCFIYCNPVGWYVMHSWLRDFAYRISIHWWVFIIAAVIAVLIAFLTISTQAMKAALTNPVKSLRTE
jgi:putative ABC transport system permease protein